jgi:hypothetical protein
MVFFNRVSSLIRSLTQAGNDQAFTDDDWQVIESLPALKYLDVQECTGMWGQMGSLA